MKINDFFESFGTRSKTKISRAIAKETDYNWRTIYNQWQYDGFSTPVSLQIAENFNVDFFELIAFEPPKKRIWDNKGKTYIYK